MPRPQVQIDPGHRNNGPRPRLGDRGETYSRCHHSGQETADRSHALVHSWSRSLDRWIVPSDPYVGRREPWSICPCVALCASTPIAGEPEAHAARGWSGAQSSAGLLFTIQGHLSLTVTIIVSLRVACPFLAGCGGGKSQCGRHRERETDRRCILTHFCKKGVCGGLIPFPRDACLPDARQGLERKAWCFSVPHACTPPQRGMRPSWAASS